MQKLILLLLVWAPNIFADDLLRYNGKEMEAEDFPVSVQQQIAELESEHYRKLKMLLQDAAVELYIGEKAKKNKKSVESVRKELLSLGNPTDAETKKFYEENKARIPYPYDSVKNEIKKLMVGQQKEQAKQKLLVKIEKEKKVRVLLEEPRFPKVKLNVSDFYSKGQVKAKVQIVEFADYQCPHCKHAAEAMKKVLDDYGNKVHFTYVDFPINPSGISRAVAEGAYCANKQGKFWQYHYLAFSKQNELTKESPVKLASELKLKTAEFKKCLASKDAKEIVERGRQEGERVGVSGTPGLFINGRMARIAHDVESLKAAIDKALAGDA